MVLKVDAAMLDGAIRARKLTLKSVAQQASVTEGHLRSMVSGRKVVTSQATADQLARVLGIDSFFIARDETP